MWKNFFDACFIKVDEIKKKCILWTLVSRLLKCPLTPHVESFLEFWVNQLLVQKGPFDKVWKIRQKFHTFFSSKDPVPNNTQVGTFGDIW